MHIYYNIISVKEQNVQHDLVKSYIQNQRKQTDVKCRCAGGATGFSYI